MKPCLGDACHSRIGRQSWKLEGDICPTLPFGSEEDPSPGQGCSVWVLFFIYLQVPLLFQTGEAWNRGPADQASPVPVKPAARPGREVAVRARARRKAQPQGPGSYRHLAGPQRPQAGRGRVLGRGEEQPGEAEGRGAGRVSGPSGQRT